MEEKYIPDSVAAEHWSKIHAQLYGDVFDIFLRAVSEHIRRHHWVHNGFGDVKR